MERRLVPNQRREVKAWDLTLGKGVLEGKNPKKGFIRTHYWIGLATKELDPRQGSLKFPIGLNGVN